MRCAIVDYGSGNLRSAAKALERAARDFSIPAEILVTADAAQVQAADRVVIPGVGAFADCRAGLLGIPGMGAALEAARAAGKPMLGICVGMQLMAELGFEHGTHPGLGWVSGNIRRIAPAGDLRVPQMGWNRLSFPRPHPLLAGIEAGAFAYFVHSYALAEANPAQVLASTDYGGPIVAAVVNGTVAGTQFHPEKSQENGLRLLANFLPWQPAPMLQSSVQAQASVATPDPHIGNTALTGS